jgi:signal transduction histidine kinase
MGASRVVRKATAFPPGKASSGPEQETSALSAEEKTPSGRDDRLIELSLLAGGLAHEIRNPLSTLRMNLQLLDEDLRRPQLNGDVVRRACERIGTLQREIQRLSDVLDDFLRFARMPTPEFQPHDMNEVVAGVLRFIAPEAQRQKINILTSYGDLPTCHVDKDLFTQALLNVLLNAQQAMPNGGDLMVRTTAEGDRVRINIADTGHGIPEEVLPRIFEPYFSTKREGTGLGLCTVKRILEEHGAHVQVHSQVKKGTSFDIVLPVLTPTPDEPRGVPGG